MSTQFEVGKVSTTGGTEDVTNRNLQPRLVIYPDGYGVPIYADPGDYVVMEGYNLPPDVTERGCATYEPRKLLYVGPVQALAYMVARNWQKRHDPDYRALRAERKPLPSFYVYRVSQGRDGNVYFNEVSAQDVWLGSPEPPADIDNMIAYLERSRENAQQDT